MEEIESASATIENEHQCKELVIDIPDNWEPVLWPQCCIYKVPGNLREVDEKVYTPQLISIGPLHHGDEKLAQMETQKSIYLAEFFNRREFSDRKEEALKEFQSILSNEEKKIQIRRCYAEKSEFCSHEYVKMILLDAVFIIELFLRNHEKKEEKKLYRNDCMLTKLWLKNGIQQDLLLLENQLPYFVLNELYEKAFTRDHEPTFHQLTRQYFANYNPNNIVNTENVLHFTDLVRYFKSHTHSVKKEKPFTIKNLLHFTDLVRCFKSHPHSVKEEKPFTIKNLPSASKLHEAGVKFVAEKTECLTNIQFEKGELKIPPFEVYDTTGCVFRNLMALEQCHYPDKASICNYIRLMDYLINTANDVDLLVEKDVIVNKLGSNEAVAKLVNELCKNNIESYICCQHIYVNLNKFYREPYHRVVATFWGVYFSNFWRGTSTVAAVVLLLLTFAQTVTSILAFFY